MAGIFISYRQADTKAWAISLRDDLAKIFGEEQVFLDKEMLRAGNWRNQIQNALDRCSVVLILIGPQWLSISDEQNRPRISLSNDVHHQEILLALSHSGVTVIPILVDEAAMPRTDQLPDDIKSLCDLQAYKIGDTQARRKADLDVLTKDIQIVGKLTAIGSTTNSGNESLTERHSFFKFDFIKLGIALVLVFFLAILTYLSNSFLSGDEIFFLFLMCYALVSGIQYLWLRHIRSKKGNE